MRSNLFLQRVQHRTFLSCLVWWVRVNVNFGVSKLLAGQITRRVAPSVAPSTGCSIIILFFRMNIVH